MTEATEATPEEWEEFKNTNKINIDIWKKI